MNFLKSKLLIMLIISALSLTVLAGCGESAETENPQDSATTDEPQDSPTDDEPTVEPIIKIEAEKLLSHTEGQTVYPGEILTYTFKVKNEGNVATEFNISDTVAENTEYLSGADSVDGKSLSWTVALEVGQSKDISYTVMVKKDMELCNGAKIESTVARVNGAEVKTTDVYVERTLNSADVKYIDYAIDALADSKFSDVVLIKWIYTVAFSQTTPISSNFLDSTEATLNAIVSGTASEMLRDMVAPGLYGGKDVTEAIEGVKGAPGSEISRDDLIIGDVLIAIKGEEKSAYIYGADGLYLIECGCVGIDTDTVLAGLTDADRFAVIRPSVALLNFTPTDLDKAPDVLNEKQQALVDTAKYYLQRGEWLQYDDSYFSVSVPGYNNESRWEVAMKTPEESTSQDFGYINCAAFTHDVYWTVFGQKLPASMYTTKNLANGSLINGMNMFYFTRLAGQAHTEEEMAKVKTDFWNTVEPGDILVILRGSYGHAMLYIGDGVFIHSSGSSYNYANEKGVGEEKYEPTIRYHRVNDYFFDETSTNGYVFGEKVTTFTIVRPLNNETWKNYGITDTAKARLENLQGIIGEKLPSVAPNVTVNPGDTITYTFVINNTNYEEKTLTVTDKIPANTVYVSGAQNLDGDTVSFNVTVPARTKIEVSYTVRVLESVPYGTEITAKDALISGVPFKTYSTFVRRTLTADEQAGIINEINKLQSSFTSLRGFELLNEVYKNVLGIEVVADTVTEVVASGENGVFTAEGMPTVSDKQTYRLNLGSTYCNLVAPSLFGGRRINTGDMIDVRTELPLREHLVVGDLILGRTLSSYVLYLYVGDNLCISLTSLSVDSLQVETRLERLHGYGYFFAILRPSFAAE